MNKYIIILIVFSIIVIGMLIYKINVKETFNNTDIKIKKKSSCGKYHITEYSSNINPYSNIFLQ